MNFCPNCGKEWHEHANFCPNWGAPADEIPASGQFNTARIKSQGSTASSQASKIEGSESVISKNIPEELDLGLIENFKKCILKKYATFDGRASRSEFWYFGAANLLIANGVLFFFAILGAAFSSYKVSEFGITCYGLYSLVVLVPGLAVSVRRVHDINKSGMVLLASFIPIVGIIWLSSLFAARGDEGNNDYGKRNGYIPVTKDIATRYRLLDTTQPLEFVAAAAAVGVVMYILSYGIYPKYL